MATLDGKTINWINEDGEEDGSGTIVSGNPYKLK